MIYFKTWALILVNMQNDFLAKGGYYDRKQRYQEQVHQGFLSDKEMKCFLSKPFAAPNHGFEFRAEGFKIIVENVKKVFTML